MFPKAILHDILKKFVEAVTAHICTLSYKRHGAPLDERKLGKTGKTVKTIEKPVKMHKW